MDNNTSPKTLIEALQRGRKKKTAKFQIEYYSPKII